MKAVLFILSVSCLLASGANASQDPDPSRCQTSLDNLGRPRLLLIPDRPTLESMGAFTVTVNNSVGYPINGAIVLIEVGGIEDMKVVLCAGAEIQGTANALGQVTFNIAGGGCYKAPDAFRILANGIPIRNFTSVESPDYAGLDNAGVPGRWSRSITAADFAAFGQTWQGGHGPASCHDYNGDDAMNAADFSIFGLVWDLGSRYCEP
jgi:hypothetical protein